MRIANSNLNDTRKADNQPRSKPARTRSVTKLTPRVVAPTLNVSTEKPRARMILTEGDFCDIRQIGYRCRNHSGYCGAVTHLSVSVSSPAPHRLVRQQSATPIFSRHHLRNFKAPTIYTSDSACRSARDRRAAVAASATTARCPTTAGRSTTSRVAIAAASRGSGHLRATHAQTQNQPSPQYS